MNESCRIDVSYMIHLLFPDIIYLLQMQALDPAESVDSSSKIVFFMIFDFFKFLSFVCLILTPVEGLNWLPENFSRFSELSSEFEFGGSFSSNVKVNPVFS